MKNQINISVRSIVVIAISLGLTACNSLESSNLSSSGTVNQQNALGGAVSLSVYTGTGSLLYSDASDNTAPIAMSADTTYDFRITPTNFPANGSIQMQITDTDVVGGSPTVISLVPGDNNYMPTLSGDYTYKISLYNSSGSLMTSKTYQSSVECLNPNFTANSLNAAGISVTASGSNNLFNFSAASVVSGANGQAPYLCAFDLTGSGIVDTTFSPCTTPVTNQYVNYVGSRNIGVIVKDSCNTTYTVSHAENLAHSTPSSPGNVFIAGQVSGATGLAVTDPRINNVTYLATNAGGNNIVQPHYGGTNFTIQAEQNYGLPSSLNFGVQIVVSGLGGTFNITSNVNGTIDTSNARISSVIYSTDQAGDQTPAVSLQSNACTSTGIHAQVLNPVGQPCSAGSTGGSNNTATVEVWGQYSCASLSAAGEAMTFTGTFDGYTKLVDSCSGGGGGGGGLPPIQL